MEKFPSQDDFELEKARQAIRLQNMTDYASLKREADDVKYELNRDNFSEAAKAELRARLEIINQGISMLRNSIEALSQPDMIMTTTAPEIIKVDITDENSFFHNIYTEKLNELESLKVERDNLFDLLDGEKLQAALADVDARIKFASDEAVRAQLKYEGN